MSSCNKVILDFEKFTEAQSTTYLCVLEELKSGKKSTCWMWFIFPQIRSLGRSKKSIFFALKSLEEAQRYSNHPILGQRFEECAQSILDNNTNSVLEIFSYPDNKKLHSSVTLFSCTRGKSSVLSKKILEKLFSGKLDLKTMSILKKSERG